MKTILFLLVTLCSSNLFSQNFEGIVRYKYEYVNNPQNENLNKLMKRVQPEFSELFIQNKLIKKLNYNDSAFINPNFKYIIWRKDKLYSVNGESKEVITSIEDSDQNYSSILTSFPPMIKEILGYQCELYTQTRPDGEYSFWIAKKLPSIVSDGNGLIINGYGVVLEFKYKSKDLNFSYRATKVIHKILSKNDFSIPEGYKIYKVDMKELTMHNILNKGDLKVPTDSIDDN
jgi:hypothetical protein